jgi:hypothetical protein
LISCNIKSQETSSFPVDAEILTVDEKVSIDGELVKIINIAYNQYLNEDKSIGEIENFDFHVQQFTLGVIVVNIQHKGLILGGEARIYIDRNSFLVMREQYFE